MDPSIIAAIIGAGASVTTAGAMGVASGKMNKRAENFNREEAANQRAFSEYMANKQNAWNTEFWERASAYDSPAAQMERLREAGLNPLYFGLDGNASQAAPTAAQPLGYERAVAPNYRNPVGDALEAATSVSNLQKDIELKDAQISKIKSETNAIDAKLPFEVDELKSRIRSSNLSSDAQETINKYIDRQQEAEIRLKNANANEADAMVKKSVAEIEKMDYDKTTMFVSWLETQEKILNLQKQRELTDKQMEELSSLIHLNNANAEKIGLDVSNYDDVTVIGNASHSMRFGPFSVQEGEPITLAMKKAAEQHLKQLEEEKKKKKPKNNNQSYGLTSQDSPYNGPIYD